MELQEETPDAHLRAREDLADDRLWKARDRLTGFLANSPTDQPTLELLGEVCFAQRDLPAAGRYWYLTARDDDTARAARAAFKERCGDRAANMTSELKPRAPVEAWPPPVQRRLLELQAKARREGFRWEPDKRPDKRTAPSANEVSSLGWREKVAEAAFVSALLVLFPFAWAIGVMTVGSFLFRLLP